MDLPKIDLDPNKARALYREYRANRHFSESEDAEIKRVLRAVLDGKVIVRALDAIARAGAYPETNLPKLAIARADAKECWYRHDGHLHRSRFASSEDQLRKWHPAADQAFEFPQSTFPSPPGRNWSAYRAIAPKIPRRLLPAKGKLTDYHVLWEAEWEPMMPADPVLLRRLGKADLWVAVAAWDLTPLEQAVLSARISGGTA